MRQSVKDSYPPGSQFMKTVETDVPETLKVFLEEVIVKGKKGETKTYKAKCVSIAHAIISATRPRSFISSILLGIAVYVHRKFGSELLLNILSRFGFSASYKDAALYQASVILAPKELPRFGAVSQFVFDNADYNVHTIDGKYTIHCMGGIMTITPNSFMPPGTQVPKQNQMPPAQTLANAAVIPIKHFTRRSESGLKNIVIKDLDSPK